ncbi:hypothetical protein EFR63_10505, partial [Lactobacillus delbrueckii subsp. lactis]|nr:hypothetical protein [Lactobacillus delbrueckii subsp. lactis]
RVFNIKQVFNIISSRVHRNQLSILRRIVVEDFKLRIARPMGLFFSTLSQVLSTILGNFILK